MFPKFRSESPSKRNNGWIQFLPLNVQDTGLFIDHLAALLMLEEVTLNYIFCHCCEYFVNKQLLKKQTKTNYQIIDSEIYFSVPPSKSYK